MDASIPLKPPADIQDDKKDIWHYHAVMQASHAIYQRQNEEIAYLNSIHEGWVDIDTQGIDPEDVTLKRLMTRHNRLETFNESIIRSKIDLNTNRLILCYAKITRIPESLFHDHFLAAYWRNLVALDCRYNQLRQLPDSLGNLVALVELYCSSSQLQKMPDTIGNLVALRTLDCSFNQLQQLPDTIGNLNLHYLDCSHNQLQQLPATLSNLVALRTLFCHLNQLLFLPNNIQNTFGKDWCDLALARQHRPTFRPAMLALYAATRERMQRVNPPETTEEALTKNLTKLNLN